jgi:uncharacterized protein YprB with RNaseH-like and TPR domain
VDDLRKKLRRLERAYGVTRGIGGRPAAPSQGAPGPKTGSIRDQLERMESRASRRNELRTKSRQEASAMALEEALCGVEVKTPLGICYEIEAAYRPTYRHGEHRLDGFFETDMNTLSQFCGVGDGSELGAEDFLFMDLETTGLSLGTGTYVFLVGLGYFREGKYNIHQLFLRDFDEEPAFLHRTREIMEPFRHLVTFNGKRYDIPLLETRFTLQLQPGARQDMASWDLLYPARRLWYDRLEDCRLGTLERERLGVAREGMDIPGEQIPGVYFRYVHDRDARDMARIAYHNVMDVLTLTTLAIHIDRSLKEKDPVGANLFSVGRYYERRGMQEAGEEYFEAASHRGTSPEERQGALLHLARQRKRQGRIHEALPIWRDLMEQEGGGFLASCVEMAKYLEHETREFDEAIDIVSHALARVGPDDDRVLADLEKRLERLKRKRDKA